MPRRGDAATIRALWAIQDKLALTPEQRASGLKHDLVAGQERITWNPSLSISTNAFDFPTPKRLTSIALSRPGTGARRMLIESGSNRCSRILLPHKTGRARETSASSGVRRKYRHAV